MILSSQEIALLNLIVWEVGSDLETKTPCTKQLECKASQAAFGGQEPGWLYLCPCRFSFTTEKASM